MCCLHQEQPSLLNQYLNHKLFYSHNVLPSSLSINLAKSMALAYWRGSKTLIGGGDTLEAMKRAGVSEAEVSHVSTGGGATLRFLAGNEMPGIEVLN